MQRRPRPSRRLLLALVALPALAFLTAQIVLAAPPAANFTISDSTPVRAQTVTFDAAATDSDGDTISSFEWDFGDGTTASGPNVSHAYSGLGTKTVTLTVTDSANETTAVTDQVTVENVLPSASLSVSDTTPARGQSVGFNASATDPDGDALSYEWNFGDGATASGQSVTHAYPASTSLGAKTVTLTVTDSANGMTVVTEQVTVQNSPPNPVFSVSDPTPDVGQTVTFDGSASSDFEGPVADTDHDWDLDGNGSFESTGKTPSRSYSTPGTVTVRLQVTDTNGARETATQTLTVNNNNPPTAALTHSHVDQAGGTPGVDVGETVNFNGSGSDPGEPSDSISKYEWDLDGNGTFETTGVTPSRSYSTSGAVTVTLRVTDASNATDTATQTITVSNAAPTAGFTMSHVDQTGGGPGVEVEETVNFNGLPSSAGEPSDTITKYEWDLDGNGTFESTGQTQSRAYTTPGPVDVKLRVTDGANATHVTSTPDLQVNGRPVARVGILIPQAETGQQRSVPLAGQAFEFTGGAVPATPGAPLAPGCQASAATPASLASSDFEGPIAAYQWDLDGNGEFNDATTQNVPSPPGGFPAGPRSVGLRVIDSAGASHTATLAFRVNAAPTPGFVLEPVTPVIGQGVTFSTTSGDPDAADSNQLTHSWDLDDDGAFCEAGEQGPSVQRVFTTAGAHTVKLRVTDPGGITREVTREVLVQNTIPTASFGFSPDAPVPGQAVTFAGSGSSPTGKPIAGLEWNFAFDSGGFDPGTDQFPTQAAGASVTWSFATAGPQTVALKISEVGGGFRIVTRTIVVNAPPTANFAVSDPNPFAGVPVTLSSTSQDPDGPLASQQWDLDNDGQFDDAAGAVAFATFATPGAHTVRLRVTDSKGASSTAASGVTVRAVPPPPPPPPPELLQGVVIRIKGSVLGGFTKVKRLLVRAPQGANVLVRCRGKSCPNKTSQASELSKGRQLRFKQLERRMRPGTRINVQVTKPGFVGRVTRFTMRKRAAPKRADLCLPPGAKRPASCPGW
jgi:large repetitive protein